MNERWIEVDGRRFRVVLRAPLRYRGELVPCRGCRQLGKAMTVRHVERVFGADGGELLRDSPDGSLAANTFSREHLLAGPLCRGCRFIRTIWSFLRLPLRPVPVGPSR